MNFVQLVKFALQGLWRQKVRTSLTLVGVAVGTCALAFSLALGLGLREFIETEFKGRDDFWRVLVRVDEQPPDENKVPERDRAKIEVSGSMSDERRARLREALLNRYLSTRVRTVPKPITKEAIAEMEKLPDVAEVRTFRTGEAWLWVDSSERPATVTTVSGSLEDLRPRLIAGQLPSSPAADEIIVSELALYQLGIRDDADVDKVIGRSVKLDVGAVRNSQPFALVQALVGQRPPEELTRGQMQVLEKLLRTMPQKIDAFDLSAAEKAELQKLLEPPAELPEEHALNSGKTVSGTYRICGVVRLFTHEEKKTLTPLDSWELQNGEVFLPAATGEKLFTRLPWVKDGGFYSADVRVKPGGDLPGTVSAIEAMGYRTHSGAKWFAAAKREVTLIAAGLNLFAMIALFVASIGITNTLVTSVIERTKEIGILRAVGATRGQIMALFLLEGAIIGLVGAAVGLALSRGLAIWADDWVRGLIAGQMNGEKMLSTTIFVFPEWLWVGSICFAVGVTTLAALYPARRAARIHPIEALRYG